MFSSPVLPHEPIASFVYHSLSESLLTLPPPPDSWLLGDRGGEQLCSDPDRADGSHQDSGHFWPLWWRSSRVGEGVLPKLVGRGDWDRALPRNVLESSRGGGQHSILWPFSMYVTYSRSCFSLSSIVFVVFGFGGG